MELGNLPLKFLHLQLQTSKRSLTLRDCGLRLSSLLFEFSLSYFRRRLVPTMPFNLLLGSVEEVENRPSLVTNDLFEVHRWSLASSSGHVP